MRQDSVQTRNRAFIWAGLGVALLVAVFLSPFASSDPDGLDRVAQDLEFEDRAVEEGPAQKLPFYQVFEEYQLRGAPEGVATSVAGLVGTLVTFGLAWGLGKVVVQRSATDIQTNVQADVQAESSDQTEP